MTALRSSANAGNSTRGMADGMRDVPRRPTATAQKDGTVNGGQAVYPRLHALRNKLELPGYQWLSAYPGMYVDARLSSLSVLPSGAVASSASINVSSGTTRAVPDTVCILFPNQRN